IHGPPPQPILPFDVRAARCWAGGCGPPSEPDPTVASFQVTKHLAGAACGLDAIAAGDLGQLGGGELVEFDLAGRVLRQGRSLGLVETAPVCLVLPRADDILFRQCWFPSSCATVGRSRSDAEHPRRSWPGPPRIAPLPAFSINRRPPDAGEGWERA